MLRRYFGLALTVFLLSQGPVRLAAQKAGSGKNNPTAGEGKRCAGTYSSNPNPACEFLAHNYDEIRQMCGLSVSKSLWNPWTWHAKYKSIDSVPKKVLYRIDQETFSDGDQWVAEDREALSRLMSFVYAGSISKWPGVKQADPPSEASEANASTKSNNPAETYTLTPGQIKYLSSSASVGRVLSLPGLPAYISRETRVVQTSSCSDVLSAMASAGVSLAAFGASAKVSAQSNSNLKYRFIYGLFKSPLAHMEETPSLQQAFYLQALRAYLAYQENQKKAPADLNYIKAARAFIFSSILQSQTDFSAGANAGGQYGVLFGSFQASGSGQDTSNDNVSSQEFHVLVGDVAAEPLPKLSEIATSLGQLGVAQPAGPPKLDPSTNRAIASVSIAGMPSDLCTLGLWRLDPLSKDQLSSAGLLADVQRPLPQDLHLDSVAPATSTSDSSTPPGRVWPSSPVECTFTLSADGISTFAASIALFHQPSGSQPSDGKSQGVEIPFTILYKTPVLVALRDDPPQDWWFQLQADSSVDKSRFPETTAVQVSCNPPASAAVLAGYNSLHAGMKGDFLELSIPRGSASVAPPCSISGHVTLFQQDGTPVEVEIPIVGTQVPPTPKAAKSPAPVKKAAVAGAASTSTRTVPLRIPGQHNRFRRLFTRVRMSAHVWTGAGRARVGFGWAYWQTFSRLAAS